MANSDYNESPKQFEAMEEDLDTYRSYPESFEQSYCSLPVSQVENYVNLENGNRIIMPASAIDKLVKMNVEYPLTFEIMNPTITTTSGGPVHVTYCGVLEFSAEEGFVYLPQWMMNNLKLDIGSLVVLKNVKLPKGTFMKIQPHRTNFINLPNPKEVLEYALREFACVSAGDTIRIAHEYNLYFIDILETKPDKAISLVETDCEVDFAPPLDYKEPGKKRKSVGIGVSSNDEPPRKIQDKENPNKDNQKPQFKPFSGVARRLDGQPVCSMPVAALSSPHVKETDHTTASEAQFMSQIRAGKLAFGPDEDVIRNRPDKSRTTDGVSTKEKATSVEIKTFQAFTGKKYTLGG